MLQNSFRVYILLLLFIILGCNRGGNILMVGGISGPNEVPEGTTVEYSVDAESSTGFTYNWVVNPVGFGTLGSPTAASTTFTAPDVDSDFEIVIRVVVNYKSNGPVVRSLDVTVRDITDSENPDDPPDDDPPVNHPPAAAAHVDDNEIIVGDSLQFYDDSTDPDGDDDILSWEWDFSYDADDGFNADSIEKEPIVEFPEVGTFIVQLRVSDYGGLTDLLDDPIQITAAQIYPVTFTGFILGNEHQTDPAIGIGVDPDGYVYLATLLYGNPIDIDPGDDVYELNPDHSSTAIIKYAQPDFNVVDAAVWPKYLPNKFTGDSSGNFYISGYISAITVESGAYIKSIIPTNLNNWEIRRDNSYIEYPLGIGSVLKTYYFSQVAINDNGDIFYAESEIENDSIEGITRSLRIYKGSVLTDPEEFLCITYLNQEIDWDISIGAGCHGIVVLNNLGSVLSHYSLEGNFLWDLEIEISDESYYLNTSIGSDAEGNYYVLRINGNNVTTISPDGEIIWELKLDAITSDIYVYQDGSVLVTGSFTETVDFDPGPGQEFRMSPGKKSGYVSAFDSNGNFLWVETWGKSNDIWAYSITADNQSNIYVCGYFNYSIDLGPPGQPDIHYSDGWRNMYVLKLSP